MPGFYEYFSDKDFEEGRKLLLEAIDNDRKKTTDVKKQGFLFELSQHPINTVEDLLEVDYLYNDGNLRSYEEVSFRNSYNATQKKRDNYDEIRHKNNVKHYIIPFIVTFIVTLLIIRNIIIGPIFALTFAFIAAYIGMIVGYKKNVEIAKSLYITKEDPRVKDEIHKKNAAITAGVTSAVIIFKHLKKAVKNVQNVDSWEEMK